MLTVFSGLLVLAVAAPGDDGIEAHVKKLGGKMTLVNWYKKDEVRHKVDLRGLKISDDDLAPLARSTTIVDLDLAFTPVGDAGMKHVSQMRELAMVDLSGTKVTDAGLERLGESSIHTFKLAATPVTDKGIVKLVERRKSLSIARVATGDKLQFQVIEEYRDSKLFEKRLMIGDTHYGFQFARPKDGGYSPDGIDRSRMATTYYHADGPVGQVFKVIRGWAPERPEACDVGLPASLTGLLTARGGMMGSGLLDLWSQPPVAVIRITAGTYAAYASPLQRIDFYNSTPEIAAFSVPAKGKPRMFDYIHDAKERGAIIRVIEGDERASLAKGPRRFYGALFAEVTTTDLRNINTNLLTKEAVATLMDNLAEKGILCYHVSHRYHDLVPPLADAAKDLGFACKRCQDKGDYDKPAPNGIRPHFSSEWVMIARKAEYLEGLTNTETNTWTVPTSTGAHLWRDGQKHDLDALARKK
jgi:hypothetical protein